MSAKKRSKVAGPLFPLGLLLGMVFWGAMASNVRAQSFGTTLDLDISGVNFAMDSEANGDLHLVWRAGTGGDPGRYCELRYLHYTRADNTWHFPSILVANGCGSLISQRIDWNQPKISVDPSTPGRAYIAFAGDIARLTQPTLVQVDTELVPQGVVTRTLGLGQRTTEIKGIDLAVGPTGMVNVGYLWIFPRVSKNRINIFRGATGGTQFFQEKATGSTGVGKGLDLLELQDGRARVFGTFNKNGVYSRRDGISGGAWTPGPNALRFLDSSGAAYKGLNQLRVQPVAGGAEFDLFLRVALPPDYLTWELVYTRYDGTRTDLTTTLLHRYTFNNNFLGGGDRFSTDDFEIASSAGGRIALVYGIDGTLWEQRNDLGLVAITTIGSSWPLGFVDVDDDGLNDGLGIDSLDGLRGDGRLPAIVPGADGRLLVVLDSAECPTVAFSKERLWIAYYDQVVGRARLTEVFLPNILPPPPTPSVPEMRFWAMLLALLALGGLLSNREKLSMLGG